MKIYVVCEYDYDYHEIVIAFTNKKIADLFADVKKESTNVYGYSVKEVELVE